MIRERTDVLVCDCCYSPKTVRGVKVLDCVATSTSSPFCRNDLCASCLATLKTKGFRGLVLEANPNLTEDVTEALIKLEQDLESKNDSW